MKTKNKKIPALIEKYRVYLSQDNPEIYFDCDDPNCNVMVNAPRALICQSVQSEIHLLLRLVRAGVL